MSVLGGQGYASERLASAAVDIDSAGHPRTLHFTLKVLVTLILYVLVFYQLNVTELISHLSATKWSFIAFGILLYGTGQILSAYKWYLLTKPVRLPVSFPRLLVFYFIGMFFNLVLPTIVGGDAVKAYYLTRETGAPARSTVSVFMERNVGLLALFMVALAGTWFAPAVTLKGLSLFGLTASLFAAFLAANVILYSRPVYELVDRIIAITPIARWRPRAASLHSALLPYVAAPGSLVATVLLSFVFQLVVITVVFLNARALGLHYSFAAFASVVPLISVAGMIPVSVNGLGMREALYLLLFGQMGASSELAVSLALLYLAVTAAASLPGGVLYALTRRQRSGPP